ncbi:subtilisin-like protease [Penicillium lagena]|uniref:subtilisin-like protease n=1 Tax=Penicillium lagena TaxID=94218 RepID=UPI0025413226|nr:subtilisin-like protease [Penicillium lagena]KAJ5613452.1 subtilisin-like protease [Penicillium lagena]
MQGRPFDLYEQGHNDVPTDHSVTNFSIPGGIIPQYDDEFNPPKLGKRATGYVWQQSPTVAEMKFLSQPPGTRIWNLVDFAFSDYAGSGITIYVHDSGINTEHEEFTRAPPPGVVKGKVEWLYPERHGLRKFEKKKGQPTTDPDGHGTCAADKAMGQNYGAAKGASLKMVPWVDLQDHDWMLGGLEAIVKDIEKQKQASNGAFFPVVSLSYSLGTLSQSNRRKYRLYYKQMVDLGAVIVVAAGNDKQRGRENVDQLPGLFAQEDDFADSMVVVGSVDIDGYPSRFSQGGPLVHVWAPGTVNSNDPKLWGVECALPTGTTGYTRKEGTSFAAPTVAGVAAYLLSVYPELRVSGSSGKLVAARLKRNAYVRMNLQGGKPGVWNEEYGDTSC